LRARLLPFGLSALLLLSSGGLVALAALGGWLAAAVEGADVGLPPNGASVALEGHLVVEHGHRRDNRGFTNYALLANGRELPLRLPQSLAAERPSGKVAVTGRADTSGALVVDQLRVLAAAQPPISTGAQRTAVILLEVGSNVTNVYGTNKAYTAQLVYGSAPTSANSFYFGASYGQTQIVKGTGDTSPDGSGSIFGPYQTASIPSCSVSAITALALTLAGSAINPDSYDRIVVSLAYPTTPCGFGGVSVIYPLLIPTPAPTAATFNTPTPSTTVPFPPQ